MKAKENKKSIIDGLSNDEILSLAMSKLETRKELFPKKNEQARQALKNLKNLPFAYLERS